jgi:hypothetical protein
MGKQATMKVVDGWMEMLIDFGLTLLVLKQLHFGHTNQRDRARDRAQGRERGRSGWMDG